MKPVRLYTTPWCPYCHRAKDILVSKKVPFEEINVDGDSDQRAWLRKATGQRTVPQIFIGDESIGGCSELEVLVRRGELQGRLDA